MHQPPFVRVNKDSQIAASAIQQTFIDKPVIVTITDGRAFQGTFTCVDDGCNIILSQAEEVRRSTNTNSKEEEQDMEREREYFAEKSNVVKRWVGFVMIPGQHVINVQVKTEWTSSSENRSSSTYSYQQHPHRWPPSDPSLYI